MTPPDVREVIRKLKQRPGRGGVRLSYDEAQTVLALLKAGAEAVQRERRRRLERDPLTIGGPFS